MDFMQFVDVKLLVLIVVLYFMGQFLKSSNIPNKFIPAILTGLSVLLALLYYFATANDGNYGLLVFNGITQGVIASGLSVYCNEVIKQYIPGAKKDN